MTPDPRAVRRKLLAWFDRHRRDLPWRRDRNPYHVWVSEVMLQQTTVAAVVPFFQRFVQKFPTVGDLAGADEQEVLHAWQGLGYYRRAVHLHRAAKWLTANYGDELPDDPNVWAELPGVGRYILGAVMSQAFDRPMPIVEANSQRVLCRLYAEPADPASGPVKAKLWQWAEQLVPSRRPGDFNQAIMELGSRICGPAEPRCPDCPLQSQCRAYRDGLQRTIPVKIRRAGPTSVRAVAVVVRRADRVLIARRPANAKRWANLWEFPTTELEAAEQPDAAARRRIAALGISARLGVELATIRHSVTRYRITLMVVEADFVHGEPIAADYAELLWIAPGEAQLLPLATAQRRIAAALGRRAENLF